MVQSDLSSADRKPADQERAGKVNTYESLLSPERKQKLELLTNLIKTQQQSLIICGPEGIGKTTILRRLAKSKNARQLWSYVECDASLTFSKLVTHLSSALSLGKERNSKNSKTKIAQKLAGQLSKIAKNGHIFVLVLDDVGRLQAGVITKFLAFARECQGLQMILAITPDDLFIKRSTDYVIDDGYVVEIPPLTEKQSADFTLNFLQEHKQRFEFDTLPENFTAQIYQESQGIPGAILQGISKLEPESLSLSGKYRFNSLLWVGIIGLSIWVGLSYLNRLDNNSRNVSYVDLNNAPPPLVGDDKVSKSTQTINEAKLDQQPQTTSVSEKTLNEATDASTSSVLPTTEDILNSTLANDAASLTDYTEDPKPAEETKNNALAHVKEPVQSQTKAIDATDNNPAISVTNKQVAALAIKQASKPAAVIADQSAKTKITATTQDKPKEFNGIHGPDWVLSQNKDSYTLQIMASSDKESLLSYISDSAELRDQLAYYNMKLKGKSWYGLIYGVYPTIPAAKQAIKRLPKTLGKPYMLPINEVQSRIENYQ